MAPWFREQVDQSSCTPSSWKRGHRDTVQTVPSPLLSPQTVVKPSPTPVCVPATHVACNPPRSLHVQVTTASVMSRGRAGPTGPWGRRLGGIRSPHAVAPCARRDRHRLQSECPQGLATLQLHGDGFEAKTRVTHSSPLFISIFDQEMSHCGVPLSHSHCNIGDHTWSGWS